MEWIENTVRYQIFPKKFTHGNKTINQSNVLTWGSEDSAVD